MLICFWKTRRRARVHRFLIADPGIDEKKGHAVHRTEVIDKKQETGQRTDKQVENLDYQTFQEKLYRETERQLF